MWCSSMLAHTVRLFSAGQKLERRQDTSRSPRQASQAKKLKAETLSPSLRKSPRLNKRPLEVQNEISSSLSSSSKKRRDEIKANQKKRASKTQKRKPSEDDEDTREKKVRVHDASESEEDDVASEPLAARVRPSPEPVKKTPLKLSHLSELTSPIRASSRSPKGQETRPLIDSIQDLHADKARSKKRADKLLAAFD
eukprot:maker-scaffold631_size122145-snap-gene-0.36 protein:Tk01059 transcript:maker-scaffold631_size122145-snap-gene-0.36-mRNA-1 annotation:"transmembrane channel-like protein 3"